MQLCIGNAEQAHK